MFRTSRRLLRGPGKFSFLEDCRDRSAGRLLLDAILANNVEEVEALLQHGVNPNVTLGLAVSHTDASVSDGNGIQTKITPESIDDYAATMDEVFLWKKFFGDAPTCMHIAVLNVYRQNRYRRALEGAVQILEL